VNPVTHRRLADHVMQSHRQQVDDHVHSSTDEAVDAPGIASVGTHAAYLVVQALVAHERHQPGVIEIGSDDLGHLVARHEVERSRPPLSSHPEQENPQPVAAWFAGAAHSASMNARQDSASSSTTDS